MRYLVGICGACGRLLVKYLSLDPGLGSSGDMRHWTLPHTQARVTHAVTMRALTVYFGKGLLVALKTVD